MAIYVPLSFEDDEAAKTYVEGQLQWEIEYTGQITQRVEGVWKKPTVFCHCTTGKKTEKAFTRGKKYGWWVCTQCGKPTKQWARGDHWYTALGTDLLPDVGSLTVPPRYRPKGWESPALWSSLRSLLGARFRKENDSEPAQNTTG